MDAELADNASMNDQSRPVLDLEGWVAYFSAASIPVLRHTGQQLAELRAKANKANARAISSVILQDPLMTLRVLAYIEAKRSKTRLTDITTIERSLMMIGMEPFFNDFQDLPLVEDHLKGHPRALLGLLKVIGRTRKAAHWAREWGVYRHDLDVDEISVATLLYNISEILMWCFAPGLALQVADRQKADRTLRSAAVQTEVFGVPLYQIKQALAQTWHLPQLLMTLMDPQNAEHPRVRNVKLAIDLARHSANGWDDAALPDDFTAIEDLLHMGHETLMHRLGLDLPATPADSAETNS
jgi:HD-like signal output (HDOD) protein